MYDVEEVGGVGGEDGVRLVTEADAVALPTAAAGNNVLATAADATAPPSDATEAVDLPVVGDVVRVKKSSYIGADAHACVYCPID